MVGEDPLERVGEPGAVAGLDQEPVALLLDDVRDPAGARPDDGAAAEERLDRHARQALRGRRKHERPRLDRARRRRPAGRAGASHSTPDPDEALGHLDLRAPGRSGAAAPPAARAATRRQASASTSTFLYRSSTPTKTTRGSSGTGTGGVAKTPRSEYVVNTAAGSRPSARTSPRGELRHGPMGVGAADGPAGETVAERPEQARGRATRTGASRCASRRAPRSRASPASASRCARRRPRPPRTGSG